MNTTSPRRLRLGQRSRIQRSGARPGSRLRTRSKDPARKAGNRAASRRAEALGVECFEDRMAGQRPCLASSRRWAMGRDRSSASCSAAAAGSTGSASAAPGSRPPLRIHDPCIRGWSQAVHGALVRRTQAREHAHVDGKLCAGHLPLWRKYATEIVHIVVIAGRMRIESRMRFPIPAGLAPRPSDGAVRCVATSQDTGEHPSPFPIAPGSPIRITRGISEASPCVASSGHVQGTDAESRSRPPPASRPGSRAAAPEGSSCTASFRREKRGVHIEPQHEDDAGDQQYETQTVQPSNP